jgi:anthranilate 1,2-dioxygenase small subunit
MLDSPHAPTREAMIETLLLRHEVECFNNDYAAALDQQRLTDWVELFTEDALYVILSKENDDRGMPVGLIYCENKRMIADRAFALQKTAMFAPRYTRHMVSNLQVSPPEEDGSIRARANYLVLQVLFDKPVATLHQVGRYDDIFRRENGILKLAQRRCVYDNLLVDNALCLPV